MWIVSLGLVALVASCFVLFPDLPGSILTKVLLLTALLGPECYTASDAVECGIRTHAR